MFVGGVINMYRVIGLVLINYFFLQAQNIQAGAWPLAQGEGQFISTNHYNTSGRAYDDQWKLRPDAAFKKVDDIVFWEHGLTPKITLIGETAFQTLTYRTKLGPEEYTGFGTTALGARYNLLNDKGWVLSGQAVFLLAGGGEIVADADAGRGGNGVEIRALAGRSFKLGKRRGFADLQSAWILRDGGPLTRKMDFSLGVDVLKNRQMILQAFYSETDRSKIAHDHILPNNSLKLQISTVRKRSEKRSVQFGVFRTVAGRNIIQESGVLAGVWERY